MTPDQARDSIIDLENVEHETILRSKEIKTKIDNAKSILYTYDAK
jgi:hypothetical protein